MTRPGSPPCCRSAPARPRAARRPRWSTSLGGCACPVAGTRWTRSLLASSRQCPRPSAMSSRTTRRRRPTPRWPRTAARDPPVADVPLVTIHADGSGDRGAEGALRTGGGRIARRAAQRVRAVAARGGRASAAGRRARLRASLPVRPLSADRLPAWSTPDDKQVRSAINAWSALGRRGRVLVAVDSSGSMAGTLPGSTTTKSRLAQQALSAVVSSIAPDSDMGLWTFTASRKRDYRVLVPLGPADGRVGKVVAPAGVAVRDQLRTTRAQWRHRALRHHPRCLPRRVAQLRVRAAQRGHGDHRRAQRGPRKPEPEPVCSPTFVASSTASSRCASSRSPMAQTPTPAC